MAAAESLASIRGGRSGCSHLRYNQRRWCVQWLGGFSGSSCPSAPSPVPSAVTTGRLELSRREGRCVVGVQA